MGKEEQVPMDSERMSRAASSAWSPCWSLAGVLVGLGLWWTSDRRRIVAQFEALQEELGKSGGRGDVSIAWATPGASRRFSPTAS